MVRNLMARSKAGKGFTLSEMMVTVGVVGILSAAAIPNFIRQLQKTHQNEAAAAVAQIQSTIVAYTDEYGVEPSTWSDLSEISAVMTSTGPAGAAEGDMDEPITLISGKYTLTRSLGETGTTFT